MEAGGNVSADMSTPIQANSAMIWQVATPRPVNLRWVWTCPTCAAPVLTAGGRMFWGCECHKKLALDIGREKL